MRNLILLLAILVLPATSFAAWKTYKTKGKTSYTYDYEDRKNRVNEQDDSYELEVTILDGTSMNLSGKEGPLICAIVKVGRNKDGSTVYTVSGDGSTIMRVTIDEKGKKVWIAYGRTGTNSESYKIVGVERE